jgi:ankyrin repeat protein
VVRKQLERRAKSDLMDESGVMAVHLAVQSGSIDTVSREGREAGR